MKYGFLELVGRAKPTSAGNARDCVKCPCGRTFTARVSHLKSGKVTRCGGCEKDLARMSSEADSYTGAKE